LRGRFAAGGLAAIVALAALWAASRIETELPFPPLAVADWIIRATPGPVATFLIERLQHDAARLLAVAATVGFAALGALLGMLNATGQRARVGVAGAAFALCVLAATFVDPGPTAVAPAILGAAAAGALYGIVLQFVAATGPQASSGPTVSRREALTVIGGGTLALLGGGWGLGRIVRGARGEGAVALAAVDEVARVPPRPAFPSVAGLSPEVTSVRDHYVVDIDLVDPAVDANDWALEVGGLVEHPLSLRFDELQRRFALVEQYSVLTCVSNEVGGDLIGNSRWTGVRLTDLLDAAGVRAGALDLLLRAADGYTATIPVSRAMHPSVLLAIAHNGRALRPEHGFPCRLRAPQLYGMMNVKWLREIRLVANDARGFWAQRGWSDDGVVRTESRIDTRASVRAGAPTWLGGVAWAGLRGISKVEVSVDGAATWHAARLREPLSPYAWTQWAFRWTPAARGEHRVLCRATDGQGRVQDARRRRPHPSGASGYHAITIQAT
jgi:DMSO/TMAO reductase YedYZ molybdopterin-dependent catalytic subunit